MCTGCVEAYLNQKLMHQINAIHSGEVSSFHFKFYRRSKDINTRISTSDFNTTVLSTDQHTRESVWDVGVFGPIVDAPNQYNPVHGGKLFSYEVLC